MASSASVVSNSSVTSGSAQNSLATQSNGAGRTAMKNASKGSDSGRKQSPVDGASRRTPQPKAWTSGTNPLTQKSTIPAQSNGSLLQPKLGPAGKPATPKEASFSDKHSNDRLRFIITAAMGSIAVITTKAGDKFEGAFSTPSSSSSPTILSLKMTKKVNELPNVQSNGATPREAALTGSGPEHAMDFDIRDIADISISDLSLPQSSKPQNGASPNFQTDTDISGNLNLRERELKPWVPEADSAADIGLESGGPVVWDQFETNQRLFGTKTTYDENHYTTPLDRNAASYKQREAEAARLAREIEGTAGENAHVREERGQAHEDGEDEESKYSGVRRDILPLATGSSNAYTPPARRPPTAGPTVAGAPVDPAIISSQVSRPDGAKVSGSKAASKGPEPSSDAEASTSRKDTKANETTSQAEAKTVSTSLTPGSLVGSGQDGPSKPRSINTSVSPKRPLVPDNSTEDPTVGVEKKVLEKFRQFANSEKDKLNEKRRAQASQDRTAKLNDLKRFSTNFKLKTPIPVDLVGILAKDPARQEEIVEKAKKEHDEAKSTTTSAAASPSAVPAPDAAGTASRAANVASVGKFDASSIPQPLVDRQTFLAMRGRGGLPVPGRGDRQGQSGTGFGRGSPALYSQRPAVVHNDRKQVLPQSIPAPIPIHEGRVPPSGPLAESGMSSPQRSNLHTPTSTISTKFNAKAIEFRPNVNAPVFSPGPLSNAPSSPVSTQRTESVSRAPSPSAFFGSRKPIPAEQRPKMSDYFNTLKKLKGDEEKRKASLKEAGKEVKDVNSNGGIPHAYQTGPRWDVKPENSEKTYLQNFESKPPPPVSPHQSRSNSAQHIPYQHQVPLHLQNGSQGIPQISTPQFAHVQHQNPAYPHHYDDGHQRMPMQIPGSASTMYASPRPPAGQLVYPSPMGHPAQLAHTQNPQYYASQGNQGPMQMRQYGGGQPYMHSPANQLTAPMMVQQQSGGPYMAVPQYQQAQMYSPTPGYVYPQQNGYPSPGRSAAMMMQQGSQQSHHGGQPVMYSQQPGMNMYGQQGGQMTGMRPGYPNQQGPYGSSPMQPHHFQQRAMSSGYAQMPKMMQQQQQMQPNHGPPPNAPQQPSAFSGQMGHEDAK